MSKNIYITGQAAKPVQPKTKNVVMTVVGTKSNLDEAVDYVRKQKEVTLIEVNIIMFKSSKNVEISDLNMIKHIGIENVGGIKFDLTCLWMILVKRKLKSKLFLA
jgi:hypothetical protein